jgi:hypothetical protein
MGISTRKIRGLLGLSALVALLVAGLVPASASAATPDLEVLSAQPEPATVPVGVPTKVVWTVNVQNTGDLTTGTTGLIGPAGAVPGFQLSELRVVDFGEFGVNTPTCDAPSSGDSPRCHVGFRARPQSMRLEITDIVTATATGTLTRTFRADIGAPDTEGNGANNALAGTLQAVPGQLPTISNLKVSPYASLTAKQKKVGVGKVTFVSDRAADLKITVAQRQKDGSFKYLGDFTRAAVAGRNTQLINSRVNFHRDPPITFAIRTMKPGTYRITLQTRDFALNQRSKPVSGLLVVRARRR